MRFLNLLKYDIKAQVKNGIYYLYSIVAVIYILVILTVPESIRSTVFSILIYTDTATLGLFFMGAVVLLEKNQKVLHALSVSPATVNEYILSKIISFCGVSIVVAIVISFVTNSVTPHVVLFYVVISSIIFSLIGLIIGSNSNSLNQYMKYTIPVEVITITPAIIVLFKSISIVETIPFYTMIINIRLEQFFNIWELLFVLAFILVLYVSAYKNISRMWYSLGGSK